MWPCVWVKAWCPCVSWCECCGCCPRARVTRPRDTWHANYIQNRASLCPASAVSHTFYITTSHAPGTGQQPGSRTNKSAFHNPAALQDEHIRLSSHRTRGKYYAKLYLYWINMCQNVVYILSVSLLSPLHCVDVKCSISSCIFYFFNLFKNTKARNLAVKYI